MDPREKYSLLAAEFEAIAAQLAATTDTAERAVILEEMRAILQETDAIIASRLRGPHLPA